MRDKSHDEQIERWADYVRNNPDWKKKHKKFIDGQIIMANRFYKKLAETAEGKAIIQELRAAKIRKNSV